MPHRNHGLSAFAATAALVALASWNASPGVAAAQNVTFTPGQTTLYGGDITGTIGESPANYVGPVSGLSATGLKALAFDTSDNLYFIENGGNIIRVVASGKGAIAAVPDAGEGPKKGTVYTVAGNETTLPGDGSIPCPAPGADQYGNGCPAAQAYLGGDSQIAVDIAGNVYLADGEGQIRVVYGGTTAPPGLPSGARRGSIYAMLGALNQTTIVTDGPAVNAYLGGQLAVVAVDANGNVYTTPGQGNGVGTGYVIYAGGKVPGLPDSATVGNIYPFVNAAGALCQAVPCAGEGGMALDASFGPIQGIAVDATGNIFLSEGIGGTANSRVRAIYASGNLPGITAPQPAYLYNIAGTGTTPFGYYGQELPYPPADNVAATSANLGYVKQISLDSLGDIYLHDQQNSIRRIDPSGIIHTLALTVPLDPIGGGFPVSGCPLTDQASVDIAGDGCPSTNMVFGDSSYGVAVDSGNNIFITNTLDYNGSSTYYTGTYSLIQEITAGSSADFFSGTFGLKVPTHTETVTNLSRTNLNITSISTAGPFTVVPSGGAADCAAGTPVAPLAQCQIGLDFTPATSGPASGKLVVASDAPAGTNTITLSGLSSKAYSVVSLTTDPAYPSVAGPGQPVTVTARIVTAANDPVQATGTISFYDATSGTNTSLGAPRTVAGNSATITLTNLSTGLHSLAASYSGDGSYIASNSNLATVSVSSHPVPTVSLHASVSSVVSGGVVTLTANVTAPPGGKLPTGTISFQDGPTPLGSGKLDATGTATFATAALPVGPNSLVASYSGDGDYAGNYSSPSSVTVTSNAQLVFAPGTINLLAGVYGATADANDSGSAILASFANPPSMAVDGAGNTYIDDYQTGVIWVVAGSSKAIPGLPSLKNVVPGNVYLFAGQPGTFCSDIGSNCGDGGSALNATLEQSSLILRADQFGNVYLVGTSGADIRKIGTDGVIATIAGSYNNPGNSGNGGFAVNAQFQIADLAVDNSGNLYTAEGAGTSQPGGNNIARRIDGVTGILSPVAGTATAAVPSQNVYTGDGGPAVLADFGSLQGIAVDSQNNIFLTDGLGSLVLKVDATTQNINIYAGTPGNSSSIGGYSGDGGQATGALLSLPTYLHVDGGGNLYIDDNNNDVIREVNAKTGIIVTVAGTPAQSCGTPPCGDQGPNSSGLATQAQFTPSDFAIDPQSNLYILDGGESVVRRISVGTSAVNFGTTLLGPQASPQLFTVTNNGNQPLNFSSLTVPGGYLQQPNPGPTPDCTATQTLAPGADCAIEIQFFPTTAGSYSGSPLAIASNSSNAVNLQNTIALSGIAQAVQSEGQAQQISFPTLTGPFLFNSRISLVATSSAGSSYPIYYLVTGPGYVTGNASSNATLKITGFGSITVTAYQFGDATYGPAKPISQTITSAPAPLIFTAGSASILAGQPIPNTGYTIAGFVNGDTAMSALTGSPAIAILDSSGKGYPVGSIPPPGTYTVQITQGTLAAPTYYGLQFVNGTLNITGNQSQAIVFPAPAANVTYGQAPIALNAVANDASTGKPSGLQVVYTVTGPGTVAANILTVTGAGTIAVTAAQPGNASYSAANPITLAIQVARAPLTIAADNVTVALGAPIPSLTGYHVTGLVNGDPASVLSNGSPVITTTANQQSAVGSYPIEITQGTLASPNYAFTFVNGTLNIVNGHAQMVTFPAIPNTVYGAGPITLNASASSGLGVTYSVASAPQAIVGNQFTIPGAGQYTVVATQAGNSVYSPAQATQTFTVAQAVLTVTAQNATRPTDTANPAFSAIVPFTGFVNGDTQSSINGSPMFSTTALPFSPAGTYPITTTQGTLVNPNYSFNFVNGTLTVTAGGPPADFTATASPQALTMQPGQVRQTTITIAPANFYNGLVNLSCGNLPTNVTCTFTPSSISLDGTNTPAFTLLTVSSGTAVVGRMDAPDPGSPRGHVVRLAGLLLWPAASAGLLLVIARQRFRKCSRALHLAVSGAVLLLAVGISACGSDTRIANKGSNPGFAAPGTSTISVTVAGDTGGAAHTVPISITIE